MNAVEVVLGSLPAIASIAAFLVAIIRGKLLTDRWTAERTRNKVIGAAKVIGKVGTFTPAGVDFSPELEAAIRRAFSKAEGGTDHYHPTAIRFGPYLAIRVGD